MTEVAYPADSPDERKLLEAFLDFQRQAVLRKTEGIDDEMLRKPMVESGICLLGLVKHLAYVERWWFQVTFAADQEPAFDDADADADFRIESHESTGQIVDLYRSMIDRSRTITAAASLDDVAKRPERPYSLRWIMIHMIEETARHAGHADIVREQLDGLTGL